MLETQEKVGSARVVAPLTVLLEGQEVHFGGEGPSAAPTTETGRHDTFELKYAQEELRLVRKEKYTKKKGEAISFLTDGAIVSHIKISCDTTVVIVIRRTNCILFQNTALYFSMQKL